MLLGFAVVVTPALLGAVLMTGRDRDGLLPVVSSIRITALVVARIAQLLPASRLAN